MIQENVGISSLGLKCAKLAPNMTSPGLFRSVIQSVQKSDLKKSQICPIWGHFGLLSGRNLPFLSLLWTWRQWHVDHHLLTRMLCCLWQRCTTCVTYCDTCVTHVWHVVGHHTPCCHMTWRVSREGTDSLSFHRYNFSVRDLRVVLKLGQTPPKYDKSWDFQYILARRAGLSDWPQMGQIWGLFKISFQYIFFV